MAFTDYKSMEDVLQKEPVTILNEAFLPEQVTIDLPDWFLQDITFTLSIKSSQENEAFYKEFGSPEQVVLDAMTDNTGASQNTDDVRFREVSRSFSMRK